MQQREHPSEPTVESGSLNDSKTSHSDQLAEHPDFYGHVQRIFHWMSLTNEGSEAPSHFLNSYNTNESLECIREAWRLRGIQELRNAFSQPVIWAQVFAPQSNNRDSRLRPFQRGDISVITCNDAIEIIKKNWKNPKTRQKTTGLSYQSPNFSGTDQIASI